MVPVKSNLAAASAALAYTLSDGRLVWAAEPIDRSDVIGAMLKGADIILAARAGERIVACDH